MISKRKWVFNALLVLGPLVAARGAVAQEAPGATFGTLRRPGSTVRKAPLPPPPPEPAPSAKPAPPPPPPAPKAPPAPPGPVAKTAPAPAAPAVVSGWTVASSQLGIPAGTRGGPTAACAYGHVASGGDAVTDFPGRTVTAHPMLDGSGFTAVGVGPLLVAGKVKANAICIDRPAGYAVVRASRTIPASVPLYTEAKCPDGSVVIGGGASAPDDVLIVASYPGAQENTWGAYFKSNVIIGERTTEVYAVCAAAAAVPGREVVQGAPQTLGPGARGAVKVTCPGTKRALSVGLSSTASSMKQAALTYSEAAAGTNLARTWFSWPENEGGFNTYSGTVRLVAICADAQP